MHTSFRILLPPDVLVSLALFILYIIYINTKQIHCLLSGLKLKSVNISQIYMWNQRTFFDPGASPVNDLQIAVMPEYVNHIKNKFRFGNAL